MLLPTIYLIEDRSPEDYRLPTCVERLPVRQSAGHEPRRTSPLQAVLSPTAGCPAPHRIRPRSKTSGNSRGQWKKRCSWDMAVASPSSSEFAPPARAAHVVGRGHVVQPVGARILQGDEEGVGPQIAGRLESRPHRVGAQLPVEVLFCLNLGWSALLQFPERREIPRYLRWERLRSIQGQALLTRPPPACCADGTAWPPPCRRR